MVEARAVIQGTLENRRQMALAPVFYIYIYIMGFLVAQRVKSLPAMQETQVRSLGQEDPLEKGMATHSSILA